jgi:hypothetical protein
MSQMCGLAKVDPRRAFEFRGRQATVPGRQYPHRGRENVGHLSRGRSCDSVAVGRARSEIKHTGRIEHEPLSDPNVPRPPVEIDEELAPP